MFPGSQKLDTSESISHTLRNPPDAADESAGGDAIGRTRQVSTQILIGIVVKEDALAGTP